MREYCLLALDTLLSPDPSVPRSVVVLSAECDALHGTFIFWRAERLGHLRCINKIEYRPLCRSFPFVSIRF